MSSKEKLKIATHTVLFVIAMLVLFTLSFFAGYTVFLSILIALATNTLNTIVCIIGIFLVQGIGILTLWCVKKLYSFYCFKTGFKIERDE